MKKQIVDMVLLTKKDSRGKFFETKKVAVVPLDMDFDDVVFSLQYESTRHKKPSNYVVTYNNVTCILKSALCSVKDFEEYLRGIGQTKKQIRYRIIKQYKYLQLI